MNVCIFSGRIGKDAETKFSQSGTAITTFSLAVDEGYGEQKKTMWMRCKVFKREGLAAHLTKGKPVIVQGRLNINEWQDREGQKHTMPEVVCLDVEFQQGQARGQEQSAPSSRQQRQSREEEQGPAFPSDTHGSDE